MSKQHFLRYLAILLLCFLAMAACFGISYLYDNKYTSPAPRGASGSLNLSAADFDQAELIPLIDGWLFYPDALLDPAQLADSTASPQEVFVGQHADFSRLSGDRTAFGTGTYLLTLHHSGAPEQVTLLLPEIFSAYKLFVNGAPVLCCGSLVPYAPRVQNHMVSFELAETTQLVLQVANYTHYYSGMWYPPMLGRGETVPQLALTNFGISAVLCFSSLTLTLFTLSIWLIRHNRLFFLFGTLSASFAVYISYPMLRWIGSGSLRLMYAMEDVSFLVLLTCALAVSTELSGTSRHFVYRRVLLPICGFAVVFTLIFSLFLQPRFPQLLGLYGRFADGFRLLIALSILGFVLYGAWRGTTPLLLLTVAALFSFSLMLGLATSGLFEPIRFLWQVDYSATLLVICFAVLMGREGARITRENDRLTHHLGEEVALRTRQLEALSDERKRFLADVSHDLKAPLASIRAYMELIRLGNLQLDGETQSYLEVIEKKSVEMTERVTSLQSFSVQDLPAGEKEPIDIALFLQEVDRNNRPDTDASGIYFDCIPPAQQLFFLGWREKCARVMENLIYNAISFTPAGGSITVRAAQVGSNALITVTDTGCGIPPDALERIFERGVSLRNTASFGNSGLGLYFARTTLRELGGELSARNAPAGGAEFLLVLPLCDAPNP